VEHLAFGVRKSIFEKSIIKSFFEIASDWYVELGLTPSRSQARASGKSERLSTCHVRSQLWKLISRDAKMHNTPNFDRLKMPPFVLK
jgi:hypothetical protein